MGSYIVKTSFYFDNTFYEKPVVDVGINGYDLVDNDLDGKYELLRINTLINSSLEGIYEINALIANSDTINSKRNATNSPKNAIN